MVKKVVQITDERGLFCMKGTEYEILIDGKRRLREDLVQALALRAAHRHRGRIHRIWFDESKTCYFAEIA